VVASPGYRGDPPEEYDVTNAVVDRTYNTNYPITFDNNAPTVQFPNTPETIADGAAPTDAEIVQFIVNMEARVDELADVLATLIQDTRKGV